MLGGRFLLQPIHTLTLHALSLVRSVLDYHQGIFRGEAGEAGEVTTRHQCWAPPVSTCLRCR